MSGKRLYSMACGLLAALAAFVPACSTAPARPSVLLVVAQGVRADHLALYGYARQTSVALESLAAEGTRFDRAYASTPDPAGALASILTGRYPPEHNLLIAGAIDRSIVTLPAHLGAQGYETRLITSDPGLGEGSGIAEGFSGVETVDPAEAPELDGGAAAVTSRALEWIERGRDRSKPFFLTLVYSSPTLPFDPPEPFRTRFADGWMTGDLIDRAAAVWLPLARRVNSGELSLALNDMQVLAALYDGELAYLDDRIGALVEGMSDEGILDDTIVVFTADRGELLGQTGRIADTISLNEVNLRVPLVVRPRPGAEQVAFADSFAQDVDLYPTICDLLGLARPGSVSPQAFSLVSTEGAPRRSAAVSVAVQRVGERLMALTMSLRTSRYRYLLTPQGPVSLFDFEAEGAPRDVLQSEPEAAMTMKAQLASWDLLLARPPGAPPAERFPAGEEAPAEGGAGSSGAGAGKAR